MVARLILGRAFYSYTMNNKYIVPLSAHSLLVVNSQGCIRELFCPIRMQCIKAVHTIPFGTWVHVDKLAISAKHHLRYRVNGTWYVYECFAIIIHF